MSVETQSLLAQYITSEHRETAHWDKGILSFPIEDPSPTLHANSYYFGHPKWARDYLEVVHRSPQFQERWHAAIGSWQNKIVVDIGCAPGNVYAALRDRCGMPKLLIGVDASPGGLAIAQEVGYTPVLADAQQLPFISGFADVVTLNAALHHCDNMEKMLQEAARLVRPGGLLVTDYDLQQTMWKDNWIAHLLWNMRLPIHRLLKVGGHATAEEQYWSTATEVHHAPGDGVSSNFFHTLLEPLGFTLSLYSHNRTIGAGVLQGKRGQAPWNIRLAQRLSGVDPDSEEGALIMMCVARRSQTATI